MFQKDSQKGEIVTILTLGMLVVLGVSTVISTVFLGNKQTTSTKAEGWKCPGPNCDKCGVGGWYGAGCSTSKDAPDKSHTRPLNDCGDVKFQCDTPGQGACGNDGCVNNDPNAPYVRDVYRRIPAIILPSTPTPQNKPEPDTVRTSCKNGATCSSDCGTGTNDPTQTCLLVGNGTIGIGKCCIPSPPTPPIVKNCSDYPAEQCPSNCANYGSSNEGGEKCADSGTPLDKVFTSFPCSHWGERDCGITAACAWNGTACAEKSASSTAPTLTSFPPCDKYGLDCVGSNDSCAGYPNKCVQGNGKVVCCKSPTVVQTNMPTVPTATPREKDYSSAKNPVDCGVADGVWYGRTLDGLECNKCAAFGTDPRKLCGGPKDYFVDDTNAVEHFLDKEGYANSLVCDYSGPGLFGTVIGSLSNCDSPKVSDVPGTNKVKITVIKNNSKNQVICGWIGTPNILKCIPLP